ncbi:MAG: adenylosuccinate lyase [Tannerellaceae bacterium]|nr:adenylosuccinate lyase [Tannerellaceae bacterium]
MTISALTAISPIDGRYRNQTGALAPFFSEFALMKYRVRVEVDYFLALIDFLPQLEPLRTDEIRQPLRTLYQCFSQDDAARIKEIEQKTNHDVKAVEYFIKERTASFLAERYREFIHFGLTSQDINNTASPLALKEAFETIYLPLLSALCELLRQQAEEWIHIPMLARTHGQPASPTRLGKEIRVFLYRLEQQRSLLLNVPFSAKFGGATGNFNAHFAAYPLLDWKDFADRFVASFHLTRETWTTQISNYDNLAAFFDACKRINTILIDLSRDYWQYISLGYFKQRILPDEVGSSAMPHKVNPIDFENAEGNFGLANALFEHLAGKLPVSRLQRDLTDSTVLRNVGVPLAHTLIAFQSLRKGLHKLILNEEAIDRELSANPAVIAEGIQTILRREGFPQPYEALKALTRTNETLTVEALHQFIDSLPIPHSLKTELLSLSPPSYTGL